MFPSLLSISRRSGALPGLLSRFKPGRFWEIDAMRGVAVVLMIIYHLVFDLAFLCGYDIQPSSGLWFYFASLIATMFMFLVGVSLTISHSRARVAGGGGFLKYLRRGAGIFALGMLITVVTWVLYPQQAIIFGMLHLIGVSIPLAYPFVRLRVPNLVMGLAVFAVGTYLLTSVVVDFPWLVWLGVQYRGFWSLDYRPLLPWFGVTLVGLFAGNTLYAGGVRRFALPDLSGAWPVRVLTLMGRHSLLIYMIHQPVMIAVLTALGIIDIHRLFG
jgi:uncharacterized membrane protein